MEVKNNSNAAGRDVINNNCPFSYAKEISLDERFERLEKHWQESKPAAEHISKESITYFIKKNQELESLIELYMSAVYKCFRKMYVEDRNKIASEIMVERKKIRG